MRLTLFLLFSFILVSCQSFSHYNQTNNFVINGSSESTKPHVTGTTDIRKCEPYIPPPLPPTPKIPLEELSKNSHSLVIVDAINIRHIGALREHIRVIKDKLDTHYREYAKRCGI